MKKLWLFIYGGLALLMLLSFACLVSIGDGKLHVYFLDIGQGDAILIRTPAREYILIDGGPDGKVLQQLAEVMPFYERTIDLMVLSHPHADHINGLVDVLQRYEVRDVLWTGVGYGNSAYAEFLKLIQEKNVRVHVAKAARDYRLGNIFLDVVYPLKSFEGAHFENVNNSSVAMRILYGEEIFYFSGDLELEAEAELAASGQEMHADVFKAGHHGSRTSSSEMILDLVEPDYAVISCGVNNKFGHPHAETIQHLQERDITVYRTDLDGRVEFVSDGKETRARGVLIRAEI